MSSSRSGNNQSQRSPRPQAFSWKDIEDKKTNDVLGQGGFSTVYASKDSSVAIKIFKDEPTSKIHYNTEKKALCRFIHPHIIKLVGYCEEEKKMALVLEHMPGPLSKVLTGLDWETVLKVLKQAASALQLIHESDCVLMDLKPENVLINEHNDIRLIDFGSMQPEGSYTESFTAEYAAPEVRNKRKGCDITTKADIFCLGVVMLQLVMKEPGPYSTNKKDAKVLQRKNKSTQKKSEKAPAAIYMVPTFRANIVDESFRKNGCSGAAAEQITKLAMECIAENQKARPTAKQVKERLEELMKESETKTS